MTLITGLLMFLDEQGIGAYDPSGITGDLFDSAVPASPDSVIVATPTGGPEADFRLAYDNPTVQFRYRGTRDPRIAQARAQAVYAALQSMGDVTLPDGTYVARCRALQSNPVYIGQDQNGRPEYTQNFEFHTRGETTHRE